MRPFEIPALVVYGAACFVMTAQALTGFFPTDLYIVAVLGISITILVAIFVCSEVIAALGIFLFSFVIRSMYYVLTGFSVFPFGDPYGQFGVLRVFAAQSHISIVPTVSQLAFFDPLTAVANQYSQWPGLQILALTFSKLTDTPLLQSSIVLSLLFYLVWFVVSYALLRKLFQNTLRVFQKPVLFCMLIATSLPTTEIPTIFKYDFMTTIMLLASIILILDYLRTREYKPSITIMLVLFSGAIVVTHSYTAFVWILISALLILMMVIGPRFISRLQRTTRPSLVSGKRLGSMAKFLSFLIVATLSWWILYATFILNYSQTALPRLIISILSFSFQSLSPIVQSSFTALTPQWIILLLQLRNTLIVGLLVVGAILLILLPNIFRNQAVSAVLFSIVITTVATTLLGGISLNDRSYLLFAPLLAAIIMLPIFFAQSIKIKSSKPTAVVLSLIFIFSVGLGFWGASYAPVQMYEQGIHSSVLGQRPITWPQVATYLSSSDPGPTCILTNEIYVTSLSIPVSDWNVTNYFANHKAVAGCIVILYSVTNSSNFGFGEPIYSYQGFQNSNFSAQLSSTNLVFAMASADIYYFEQ
jgi:hypothetical protein